MRYTMFHTDFADGITSGTKIHTIRPHGKRRPKVGDRCSLRVWTGKPYRSKQRELRQVTINHVCDVVITPQGIITKKADLSQLRWLDLMGESIEQFARNDGFPDWAAMKAWFLKNHGPLPFKGVLFGWDPQDQ